MGLSATPLTPVDTLTQAVYPPQTGTPVLAADVAAGEQALLNLAWSILYRYLGLGLTLVGPGAQWTGTIAGGDGAAMQTVAQSSTVEAPLVLLHGIKIRTIKVRVRPQVIHGALPGNMPILKLYKIGLTGTLITTWTQVDTSASVAVYETPHDVTLDLGADEEIDKTAYYYLAQFVGEGGANNEDCDIGQPRILMMQFAP